MLSGKNKYVLNLAPNGMVPTKEITPYVPVTPQEVSEDISQCIKAGGITYVHLHARDENGVPTGSKNIYEKFIASIKEKNNNLAICVSCSGRLDPSFEARAEVLDIKGDLKPDMGSLTLSSLNFTNSVSINTPETIIKLAVKMQENGIRPELEIFDLGMMNFAHYMIDKGYLKPPYYFNIILGNIFSAQSKLSHLAAILNEMPPNSIWSVGGIGKNQMAAVLMSLSQGGGVRIGLEDNIWFDKNRTVLTSNSSLVERIHKLATLSELEMISPEEFKLLIK